MPQLVPGHNSSSDAGVLVANLSFAYPGHEECISDLSFQLPQGSRCLLLGANGAGKSTLLQLLAGKYMVGQDTVRILGRPAFHDLVLTSSGDLGYLGPQWRRDIAYAGSNVPMQADISAEKMIMGVEGVDAARRDRLIKLLDIDLKWRLNKVSDGQRRRVQICMGLLKPYKVLLLDEVTVDMDVVGRLDLLAFFQQEGDERGAVVIYATHIFDGLEEWITHLAYVHNGQLKIGAPVDEVPELEHQRLLPTVEAWLRKERTADKAAAKQKAAEAPEEKAAPVRKDPFGGAGRHMAFYRGM